MGPCILQVNIIGSINNGHAAHTHSHVQSPSASGPSEPAGHTSATHSRILVAPGFRVVDFVGHGSHPVEELLEAKVPSMHGEHGSAPVTENVPGSHDAARIRVYVSNILPFRVCQMIKLYLIPSQCTEGITISDTKQ